MLDSDRIMETVYIDAEKELIKFGVYTLLTQMGFKVTEFNNKISLTVDNFNRVNEIINQDEIKKVETRLRRKISYHIDNSIVKILEDKVVANAVETLRKEIVENVELHLSMNIKSKLYNAYYNQMEQELTDKVMENPQISSLLLKEL